MKLLLACGLIFPGLLLRAQPKIDLGELFLKRGYIGVEAGISLPVMDYGVKDLTASSGYASTGYQIRAGMGYEVSRFLGFRLQYFENTNPFDGQALCKDIQDRTPANSPNTLKSIAAENWKLSGMMLGIYYPLRLPHTTYEIRVMTGYLQGVLPELRYNMHSTSPSAPAPDYQIIYHAGESFGVTYQAGFGLRRRLVKDLLLIGSVDFVYGEQNFSDLILTISGLQGYGTLPDYKQYYHIVSGTIGLAYSFE